jgi:hypothetical protein
MLNDRGMAAQGFWGTSFKLAENPATVTRVKAKFDGIMNGITCPAPDSGPRTFNGTGNYIYLGPPIQTVEKSIRSTNRLIFPDCYN